MIFILFCYVFSLWPKIFVCTRFSYDHSEYCATFVRFHFANSLLHSVFNHSLTLCDWKYRFFFVSCACWYYTKQVGCDRSYVCIEKIRFQKKCLYSQQEIVKRAHCFFFLEFSPSVFTIIWGYLVYLWNAHEVYVYIVHADVGLLSRSRLRDDYIWTKERKKFRDRTYIENKRVRE